jgi:hypothetical protein
MSFAEILRHGSPDHKRDAVRMLAEVGDERHLRLLREVLVSETGELRLCAFVELDRATRRYTSRIEELRTQLQLRPDDPELVAPIAEAHRALVRSGLLDAEMERYHLRQASGFAQRAFSTQPDPETSRVYARILCDQGEYQPAADCLADLDDDARDAYPTRVLRARIGLNRREFGVVRDEARAIARGGHKLPEWLAVFGQDHADGESTNEVRWPVHLK